MKDLYKPDDGCARCAWVGAAAGDAEYLRYHDEEWGFPVKDDFRLFEKLSLEGFQSGLSWRTILNKRPAFRAAFVGFDFNKVAKFGEKDVERLLQDAGIVRHRGKIEAVINNAQRAVELVAETGTLAAYIWRFEAAPLKKPEYATETEASRALSKDLKKRGWKFVGPTTMHAFMQSMGMLNDHSVGCVTRERVAGQLQAFKRPK